MKLQIVLGTVLASSIVMAQPLERAKPALYGSAASLKTKARELVPQARAAETGTASEALETFENFHTMLAVRVRSGGAEYHEHWSDIFVVLKGGCTMVTGGTIPDRKQTQEGEYLGTKIEGGTKQILKAGDTFYIPPRTPHQALMDTSKPFVFYVIKIQDRSGSPP